ncbi:Predicted DNA-binding transcriptional regulator YafY, contains an HTH and WYL domains [Paenibacillus sp. UNCCL117]|uniref:helix-turn-helix transcriptional regulator n=1 Tax=unclassified Paenibacillus TaxID=185978 RepID=UPI000886AC0A|nr:MULTISPECIES: YafY family protein [unclassified Paenibacillus]SDE67686.1 Predicted DNA-binding transcriptional regulator YafY, contains an HTH and WYL domains [Paenibacillus sp. cl123]SFW70760.1 Predicted DNA-binding transcriptional regulator YafY, contains an HTH and WYL domains [Paenibacillus sp. UNCCL117]
MDKIERLISIIMILLKKDVVSANEFAQLFHVSKRTILRDMETLSLSNIPVYAIQGVHGGFGLMNEYKVDKRLLSSADLEHILTALGGLEKILVSEEVEMTIKKIEAMVSPLSLKGSIQLSFYDWEGRSEILPILKTCQESIGKRRLISFEYLDKDGAPTARMVEPYQLHFSETSWYLKGYCLYRKGYRTFKLSRINHLTMDEKTFNPRDYLAEQEQKASYEPQLVAIKALISPSIKDHFIERYGSKCIEAYSPEFFLATVHVPQNSTGYKFLAGFGTNLRIVEPKAYVEEFKSYLKQMMATYSKDY